MIRMNENNSPGSSFSLLFFICDVLVLMSVTTESSVKIVARCTNVQ